MNAPLAQAVPPTSPGGTADVQVSMYGPAAAGTYKGIWRLRDGNGLSFGPSLTVIVVVSAGGAASGAVPAPAEPAPVMCPVLQAARPRSTFAPIGR